MPDDRELHMSDIARRLLILNHKLACWYTLSKGDPDSEATAQAATLADLEARELLQAIQEALNIPI